ncbi:MAG: YdeI/OmpD-associated family protein [Dehalococcoidia bacterium]|nr:YdeI/OmpD-associated family protein [Dehalococcoidia bacterium]
MPRAVTLDDVTTADGLRAVYAPDRPAWRAWLSRNHDRLPGVWLVYYKLGSGRTRVAYADAVEEALCFGWIDSRTKKLDEQRYMQMFTPRKPRSAWSKLNKERVARLEAAGLLEPAGLAAIEAARRSGSWNALDSVEAFEMHEELRTALEANPGARAHFEAFSATTRKGLLAWVSQAKRPETRARRIDEVLRNASEGRRAGPFV